MLEFTANKKQWGELESLAYWIADLHYILERYGDSEPELQVARDTIEKCCFPALDALRVPFWVQNSVIAWAENWRAYAGGYLDRAMRGKNIFPGVAA